MEPAGYPAYAVEGAMKVQEVILRAVDGRLKWYQAAEILGISDRQVRRWKRCDEQRGYAGLFEGCAARGGGRGGGRRARGRVGGGAPPRPRARAPQKEKARHEERRHGDLERGGDARTVRDPAHRSGGRRVAEQVDPEEEVSLKRRGMLGGGQLRGHRPPL